MTDTPDDGIHPFSKVMWRGQEFFVHGVDGGTVEIAPYPPPHLVYIHEVKAVMSPNVGELNAFIKDVLGPEELDFCGLDDTGLYLYSYTHLTDKQAEEKVQAVSSKMEFYSRAFPHTIHVSLEFAQEE